MTYPPPPMLIFLAYATGSITITEYEDLMRLWNEKHKLPEEVSGDAD